MSIPLHLMTTLMARSAVGQLRFNTLHLAARNTNDNTLETSGRLFELALGILDEICRCLSSPNLRRFLWHMRTVHPYQYLIFILKHLLTRPDGDEVPRAWTVINRIYQLLPNLTNDKNPLFFAMGSLVLKAWNKCSEAGTRQGLVKSQIIVELEKQRSPADSRTPGPGGDPVSVGSTDSFTNMGAWGPAQQGLMDTAFSGSNIQDFSQFLSGGGAGPWDLQSDGQSEGLQWSYQQY